MRCQTSEIVDRPLSFAVLWRERESIGVQFESSRQTWEVNSTRGFSFSNFIPDQSTPASRCLLRQFYKFRKVCQWSGAHPFHCPFVASCSIFAFCTRRVSIIMPMLTTSRKFLQISKGGASTRQTRQVSQPIFHDGCAFHRARKYQTVLLIGHSTVLLQRLFLPACVILMVGRTAELTLRIC